MSISIEEKECVEQLVPMLSEHPIIIDVGANKGEWSDVVMKMIPDCCVVFIEPNQVLLHYMMIKYDYNENDIKYLNCAAYWRSGKTVPFYYFTNRNNGLSSIYRNKKWEHLPMKTGKVETISIDDYCDRSGIDHIDFIKIDVEGAETEVIRGMEKILHGRRVKFIQIEYSPHYQLGNFTFLNIINTVSARGYNVYLHSDNTFHEVTKENFVEDYELRNYIITTEILADTQDWNRAFKENVADIPKFELAMEIGCFEGKTSRYIHDNMLLSGGRIVCVDPLADQYLTKNLDEAAIKMNSELLYFKSQYTRFVRNTRGMHMNLYRKTISETYGEIFHLRFGFIFVDGDHREEAVYEDGRISFELCMIGGYILFDDYTWSEGTKRGIDRILFEKDSYVRVVKMNEQVLIQRMS